MTKLFYSKTSPYSAKVRMAAHLSETKLDLQLTNAHEDPANLIELNPLSRVPVLVTEEGQTVYDSRAITQYLDRTNKGTVFPRSAAKRLDAERMEALADGVVDSLLMIVLERRRPEENQYQPTIDRQFEKVMRALDAINSNPPNLPKKIHGGHIAMRSMIGYLQLRFAGKWEKGHTRVKSWAKRFDAKFPELAQLVPQE